MTSERTILITGANRGIGLTLARYFLKDGARVIATARQPEKAADLRVLEAEYSERLEITEFDALKPKSATELAEQISKSCGYIDWLINNAAIYRHTAIEPKRDECSSFGSLTYEALTQMMAVNTVAPLTLTQELYPLLERSTAAKIVNISSEMGSIEQNSYHEHMGYCVSKAALNMVTRKLAAFFAKDKIPVVAVSPGWVRTDMGGPSASLSVEESCEALVAFINNLSFEQTAGFYRRDGATVPW